MRTEGSDFTPYGDRRLEMLEVRPALSLNQFDMADYRAIQRDSMPAAGLPALELLDIRPGDRTAALQNDALQTEAQNRLCDRIASEFASPQMAGRGERFLQDMDRFNERARTSGLSAQEVSETYRHIERILQAGPASRLSRGLRLALASQIMHNAAEPTEIRQNENTCSVASLEVRLYTRQPSAAAALVADVDTRGAYTGSDGTVVTLDAQSLTPSRVGTVALSRGSESKKFCQPTLSSDCSQCR
ncbi:MAG: hypothetical protein IT342_21200 [Candidatus Melainabacteria bacterium]|nr:hypothetical protein [Candidatus Melainabacteria bacterium]